MDFYLQNEYHVKEIAAGVDFLFDPEAESYFISCEKKFQVLPINIRLKSFCIEGDFRFMISNSLQKTQFQLGIILYNTSAQKNIKKISANIDMVLGTQNESAILKEQRILEKELDFEETEILGCCVP